MREHAARQLHRHLRRPGRLRAALLQVQVLVHVREQRGRLGLRPRQDRQPAGLDCGRIQDGLRRGQLAPDRRGLGPGRVWSCYPGLGVAVGMGHGLLRQDVHQRQGLDARRVRPPLPGQHRRPHGQEHALQPADQGAVRAHLHGRLLQLAGDARGADALRRQAGGDGQVHLDHAALRLQQPGQLHARPRHHQPHRRGHRSGHRLPRRGQFPQVHPGAARPGLRGGGVWAHHGQEGRQLHLLHHQQ
mmetsp:Transcript_52370/g.137016  ORF Transcript_52370/g.137016 Transcript_52370/m.137016 type:complete len:245 (+) Transcript_52370:12752-13486(+)